uniref:Uncharacterized protein n=1 Tax=Rhodnius prolixus TaxID=13249 RepID=T1I2S4_RHOPR
MDVGAFCRFSYRLGKLKVEADQLLLCFMFLFLFSKFDFVFGNELENSQIRFEYWFCEDGMQVGRKWTFRFDDCIPQFVPIILVTIAIEDQVVGVYKCIRRVRNSSVTMYKIFVKKALPNN